MQCGARGARGEERGGFQVDIYKVRRRFGSNVKAAELSRNLEDFLKGVFTVTLFQYKFMNALDI